jgi:single-stranded-DNA-specific exonuclease
MKKEVEEIAREFLELSKNRPIRIISHHDTDGITSAAILAKTFRRLDKKFSIKITKGLEKEFLETELKRQKQKNEIIIFSDLASGNLDHFQNLEEPIFILDHHEIDKEKLNDKIKIINPHLSENVEGNSCTGAGVCYLFSKAISPENTDLSPLAIIGMIGDRHESELSKINQQIINDTKDLKIKKGIVLYPATRSLRRTLEYSTSPYIPGVSGNGPGVQELLRETNISYGKSLLDLNEDEMSKLITAIMLRKTAKNPTSKENIIGNLYILKFYNTQEDVREISTLINACSRLGHHGLAVSYCLGNPKAKEEALGIYTKYKQELVSGLRVAEKIDKIQGNGFVIMNAKDEIKDTIVGTICSMLSSSTNYEEGTVLIGMAYNQDKIKVSARITGREGRNLKEVLEKTTDFLKQKYPDSQIEIGGHQFAAGCLIEKDIEPDFIEALKSNLEIEIMKI